jgi:hypothetical protein
MDRRSWRIGAFLIAQALIVGTADSTAAELRLVARPPTPALVGPDPIEPSPLLAISDGLIELDGTRLRFDELGSALRRLVDIFKQLHPGQPFNGQSLVACAPGTSTRLLAEHLKVASDVGFVRPVFLLIQPDPAVKADRAADQITGARVTLDKAGAAMSLRVREYASCEALVKAVIAERRRGKVVFLDLEPSDGKPSHSALPHDRAEGALPGR